MARQCFQALGVIYQADVIGPIQDMIDKNYIRHHRSQSRASTVLALGKASQVYANIYLRRMQ